MKLRRKILLASALLLFLAQVPFVYHALRLTRLSARIAATRQGGTPATDNKYRDLAGVIHVHTALGGHSTATFDDLIRGARGLDFVIMTEHTADLYDTAALTLQGFYGGALFVGGNEIGKGTGERLLVIPGTHEALKNRLLPTSQSIASFQAQGRLALVTYPEEFQSWDSSFDGIEIFNLSTALRSASRSLFLLDAIWSWESHPALTLASHLTRPTENLKRFDEIAAKRRVTLFAGNDAHSNIGFHLLGDSAGNRLLDFNFDDYFSVFQTVRTHVFLPQEVPLTEVALLEALKQGHSYISFDVLGQPRGFFMDVGPAIMGDQLVPTGNLVLRVRVPEESRVVLFRNGKAISESPKTRHAEFEVRSGVYRIEVYLDSLGSPFDQLPWILSNPVYIR